MKQQASRLWAAGRAPAGWQDGVARQTRRLQNMRRLCAWVQPFTEVAPKLRQDPILGHCLEDLVGSAASTNEAHPAERTRSRSSRAIDQADRDQRIRQAADGSWSVERPRPGSSRSIDQADRNQRIRQAADGPWPGSSRAIGRAGHDQHAPGSVGSTLRFAADMWRSNQAQPIDLARHVDEARLSRWAGAETPTQPDRASSSRQPTAPATNGHADLSPSPHRVGETRRQSTAFGPESTAGDQRPRSMTAVARRASVSLETQRVWFQRLAQRAVRVQTMVGLTEPGMAGTFVTQWAEHLDGHTVPLELLTEWAELQPRLREVERRSLQADRSQAPPPDRSLPSTMTRSPTAASHSAGQRAGGGETIGLTTDRSLLIQALDAGSEQPRPAATVFSTSHPSILDVAHADAVEYSVPIHIAPPAIAQALPQLLPQTAREISPAVAANLAQHGAEREAIEGDVDLARLAANVKRILDEEARRYGIDL